MGCATGRCEGERRGPRTRDKVVNAVARVRAALWRRCLHGCGVVAACPANSQRGSQQHARRTRDSDGRKYGPGLCDRATSEEANALRGEQSRRGNADCLAAQAVGRCSYVLRNELYLIRRAEPRQCPQPERYEQPGTKCREHQRQASRHRERTQQCRAQRGSDPTGEQQRTHHVAG